MISLEQRLTPENITKVVRYMTQCLEDQYGQALVNLTTRTYLGKPISNSLLLHELVEAEEFEKLGYEFSSSALETVSYEKRIRLYKLKNEMIVVKKEFHHKALMVQYQYLAEVAKRQGLDLSPGTLLKCSPIHSNAEYESAIKTFPDLKFDPSELNSAGRFTLSLVKEELDYVKIFLKMHDSNTSRDGFYFYEEYKNRIVTLYFMNMSSNFFS